MGQIYKRLQTDLGELIVRRFLPIDIAVQAAYLFDSPRGFLEEIGFDTAKLPSKDEWTQAVHKRLSEAEDRTPPNVIVGELGGTAVGMLFYDTRKHADKVPRLHFHIFSEHYRGKGLGAILFRAGMEAFASIYGVNRFLIEPKKSNKRMNGLMRKLGFRHVKDYVLEAGPVTHEIEVSQYEILVADQRKL